MSKLRIIGVMLAVLVLGGVAAVLSSVAGLSDAFSVLAVFAVFGAVALPATRRSQRTR
jgi:hypothetical protein